MKKDIIEIDFTSQIQAADCDCGICDEEDCECGCHHEKAEQDRAIAFSVKIIEVLNSKAEEHNKQAVLVDKISPKELLAAFRKGSSHSDYFGNKTLAELGMARVNLLLRIKNKDFKDIVLSNTEKNIKKELSGLIFESGRDSILEEGELDMFASLMPTDTDFDKAKKDIEKYDLNGDYKNIDELYLDKYQQATFEID